MLAFNGYLEYCSTFLPIALMTTKNKSQVWRKWSIFSYKLWEKLRVETWKQEQKQRLWRNAAYWLPLQGLGWHHPQWAEITHIIHSSIKSPTCLNTGKPYVGIFFSIWSSLIANDTNLCQGEKLAAPLTPYQLHTQISLVNHKLSPFVCPQDYVNIKI